MFLMLIILLLLMLLLLLIFFATYKSNGVLLLSRCDVFMGELCLKCHINASAVVFVDIK